MRIDDDIKHGGKKQSIRMREEDLREMKTKSSREETNIVNPPKAVLEGIFHYY